MTGPVMTRAEQRAFVIALMDVPSAQWWWRVIRCAGLPLPVEHMLDAASEHDDGGKYQRECILAAADLLRPRWTRGEAEEAVADVRLASCEAGAALTRKASNQHMRRAHKYASRVIRMITGEEP